jgi:hypothetical protein
MAVVQTRTKVPQGIRARHVDTGVANTLLNVSRPAGHAGKLIAVTARYSAAPTQAGVTVTLDSGAGASYDFTLFAGNANDQNNIYVPAVPIPLMDDDAVLVSCPAGGATITATVSIVTEEP